MTPHRSDLPRWAAALVKGYCRRLAGLIDFRLDPRLRGLLSVGEIVSEIERRLWRNVRRQRLTGRRALLVWLRGTSLAYLDEIHREYLGARDARSLPPALVRLDCLPPPSAGRLAADFVGFFGKEGGDIEESAPPLVALQDAFNRLLPTDREILAMRHFERLTREEVATVFELSICRASHCYLAAVRRLRHELRGVRRPPNQNKVAQPAPPGVR